MKERCICCSHFYYEKCVVAAPEKTVICGGFREVTEEADLPAALVANTTYVIRGKVSVSTNHTCSVEGVEIIGLNRESDEIEFTGTGTFLTLSDCNFSINTVKFSSTQSNTILEASNRLAGAYNAGRSKVLTILNSQFRGTYDVMDITGYDLVDINNTLFFYIRATNFGIRFEDTSKIQITSCELIRWFDETLIGTSEFDELLGYLAGQKVIYNGVFYEAQFGNGPGPFNDADWVATGYSTVSMVELQPTAVAQYGAVNINGCIVHPQQTQIGLDLRSSTTAFGTISSNAFVPGPFDALGIGKVFAPELGGLPDYSAD